MSDLYLIHCLFSVLENLARENIIEFNSQSFLNPTSSSTENSISPLPPAFYMTKHIIKFNTMKSLMDIPADATLPQVLYI